MQSEQLAAERDEPPPPPPPLLLSFLLPLRIRAARSIAATAVAAKRRGRGLHGGPHVAEEREESLERALSGLARSGHRVQAVLEKEGGGER